jgi:hypothetical protein
MKIIGQIFTILFLTSWISILFSDYLNKHPTYGLAFKHLEYAGLIAFLLGGGILFSWVGNRLKARKKPLRALNGLALGAFFLVLAVVGAGFGYNKIDPSGFNGVKAVHALALIGGNLIALFLIVVIAYALGSFINEKTQLPYNSGMEAGLLAISSGLLGLTAMLFVLGAVSLLYSFVLIPIFVLLLVLLRSRALHFVRLSCWAALPLDKNLNALGLFSFFLLLFLTALNFAAVNVPMPAGFDALTLYANLPTLIADRHGLVEGFQPYNWSILMSLGLTLFNSVEISFGLSWLGGILSVFALYSLGRNWLKIDINHTLLGLLVFTLIPAFYLQSYGEIKVDLGLLFVYLSILLLLLGYAKAEIFSVASSSQRTDSSTSPGNLAAFAMLGILTGFAVGIKLTTLYFSLALLCAVWFYYHGKRGFFAALSASLWLIFLLKVDQIAGLRQFHLGVDRLQWALFACSVLLALGILSAEKMKFWDSLRKTLVFVLFAGLAFSPWMVKNYLDSRSLSPQILLNGVQPQPKLDIDLSVNPANQ